MQGFLIVCSKNDLNLNDSIPSDLKKTFFFKSDFGKIELFTRGNDQSGLEFIDNYEYTRNHFSINCSNEGFKVGTDLVASRTIWYYQDQEVVIVASRQSYIIRVLKSFELNEQAWLWLLASGSTGPLNAWDHRIKALKSAETLTFTLADWEVTLRKEPWRFAYDKNLNQQAATKQLENLMQEVAAAYAADEKSLVTLSGGYDSRAVLWLASRQAKQVVNTASWGVGPSFENPETDAGVAREISSIWNTKHQEFNVQLSRDFEKTFQKFLISGEGRNDHINSFMDGLAMWETIQNQGFKTVYRGDEAFGWLPVATPLDVVTSVGLTRLSDFKNIPVQVSSSLPVQEIPEYLNQLRGEELEDWRDRLYQEFRMPFIISPLQDLPLNYVNIRNPLLANELIVFARSLPPFLRTSKYLYAQWVKTLLPNVGFASIPSIPEAYTIIRSPEVTKILLEEINSTEATNLFGKELIYFLNSQIKVTSSNHSAALNSSLKVRIAALLPVALKKMIRNKVTGYQLPPHSLLLRMYLTLQAKKLFSTEFIK